ncbi:MAG: peptidoglycan DD-metalloendopeptidase family protein [Alphaproteobacteria bacterium]
MSRRLQWTAASAAAVLALWLSGTTLALVVDWVIYDEGERVARAIDAAEQKIAAEAVELRQRAVALSRQRDEARDKLTAATETVATLRQDGQQLREAHARLTREQQQAVAEVDKLRIDLGSVEQALAALRVERDAVAIAHAEASAALADTRRQAQQDLEATRTEARQELELTRAAAQRELELTRAEAQRELDLTRAQAQQDLELARAQAGDELRRAQAAVAARDTTLADLRRRLADARETHRDMLAELRAAEAAARAEATVATQAATAAREALRVAEARTGKAEITAAEAVAARRAAERRAAGAEAERERAQTLVDRVDVALVGLNDRLRRNLRDAVPDLESAVATAFADDLAAKLAQHAAGASATLGDRLARPVSAPERLPAVDHRLLAAIVDDEPARNDRAGMLVALSAMKTASEAAPDADDLLERAQSLAQRLAAERRTADRRASAYAVRIAELERKLHDLNDLQATLVGELETRTSATVVELEDTVYATGLDLNELLRRMHKEVGIGGPFVGMQPLGRTGREFEGLGPRQRPALNDTLDRLYGRLARWKALTLALERVPLTPPVDNFYISSDFGKRRDPFSKRWAVHQGIDMAGPRNSEIFATAPGTVVKAGWLGPYGRMVEIDHGFGLTTRYGHLRRILVKKGDTVAFRDRIGIMGSTGRSTSRHVHYEVRFDDEPVDPAKFIEAGRHVFKN